MTRLEMTPVPETEGRHTWDCEQHFNVEGMSSSTAVTGMARNTKECLAGKSEQAWLYHHLLPSPEHPRLVCASTPTLLKEQAHLQPKTLSLWHIHCAGHWGQSYQTPLNISRYFCFPGFLFMRKAPGRYMFLLPASLAPGTQVCMYQHWLKQALNAWCYSRSNSHTPQWSALGV